VKTRNGIKTSITAIAISACAAGILCQSSTASAASTALAAGHTPINGTPLPIAGHTETTNFWFTDHLIFHGHHYRLKFTQGVVCVPGQPICDAPPHMMQADISIQVFEKTSNKWVSKGFFPNVFMAGSWGQVSRSDVAHVKTLDLGGAEGLLIYNHYNGQETYGWSYNLILFDGKNVWSAAHIFAGESVSSPAFPQLDHQFKSTFASIPTAGLMRNLQVTYTGILPYGYPHTPYVVTYAYDPTVKTYKTTQKPMQP
jgi:hypothetical protein